MPEKQYFELRTNCPARAFVIQISSGKGDLHGNRLLAEIAGLQSLNVFSLPALRSLGDVELHRLTLLQALETARLDR